MPPSRPNRTRSTAIWSRLGAVPGHDFDAPHSNGRSAAIARRPPPPQMQRRRPPPGFSSARSARIFRPTASPALARVSLPSVSQGMRPLRRRHDGASRLPGESPAAESAVRNRRRRRRTYAHMRKRAPLREQAGPVVARLDVAARRRRDEARHDRARLRRFAAERLSRLVPSHRVAPCRRPVVTTEHAPSRVAKYAASRIARPRSAAWRSRPPAGRLDQRARALASELTLAGAGGG